MLTLPLNGSSINTKYLFRCYCATSVPNDLLIARSASRGVSKYTRKRERLAGTDALVPTRTLCNTRARPTNSLSWAKFCTTELEFAPLPSGAEPGRIQPALSIFCHLIPPHVRICGDGKPADSSLKGCQSNTFLSRFKRKKKKKI